MICKREDIANRERWKAENTPLNPLSLTHILARRGDFCQATPLCVVACVTARGVGGVSEIAFVYH